MNFIKSIIFLSLAGVDNEDNYPNSTTKPNIQYEFESLHAGPFRLLAISNQATNSSLPPPLSPTSSTLQSSALMNSGSASSSPLFSWTLFVIFFLYPVGAVDCDTDFHLIDQGKVGYLYRLQTLLFFNLQDDNNINGVNNVTISDVATMPTTIYKSNTVYILKYDNDLYFDTVLFLALMQILLYDQLLYSTTNILRLLYISNYVTVYGIMVKLNATVMFNTTFDTVFTSTSHVSPYSNTD